nr:unnamed protein product [Digitaria exilis]
MRDLRLSLRLLGLTWVKKNQEPPSSHFLAGDGSKPDMSASWKCAAAAAGRTSPASFRRRKARSLSSAGVDAESPGCGVSAARGGMVDSI